MYRSIAEHAKIFGINKQTFANYLYGEKEFKNLFTSQKRRSRIFYKLITSEDNLIEMYKKIKKNRKKRQKRKSKKPL